MEAVTKRIKRRLRALDDVIDRGLLAGTQERRDGKRLVREVQDLIAQLDAMDAERRIREKGGSHGQG